jgi:hypothetical protein
MSHFSIRCCLVSADTPLHAVSTVVRTTTIAMLLGLAGAAAAVAPYSSTDEPFVDEQGRTRVVVNFVAGAEQGYPDAVQPRPRTRETDNG